MSSGLFPSRQPARLGIEPRGDTRGQLEASDVAERSLLVQPHLAHVVLPAQPSALLVALHAVLVGEGPLVAHDGDGLLARVAHGLRSRWAGGGGGGGAARQGEAAAAEARGKRRWS